MKALTLTQPWATLMAIQKKRIETRIWSTNYRGEFVVHAAKGFPGWAKKLCDEEPFKSALGQWTPKTLPLSQGLCVVRLLGCFPTTPSGFDKLTLVMGKKPDAFEIPFGDYSEGRFMWLTEYVRPLPYTGEVKGKLGLWWWSEEDRQQVIHDEIMSGRAHL